MNNMTKLKLKSTGENLDKIHIMTGRILNGNSMEINL